MGKIKITKKWLPKNMILKQAIIWGFCKIVNFGEEAEKHGVVNYGQNVNVFVKFLKFCIFVNFNKF